MSHPYPSGGGQPPWPPTNPNVAGTKKNKKWPWIVGIAVALFIVIAITVNGSGEDVPVAESGGSSPVSSSAAATPTMSSEQFKAQSAARAAEAERQRVAQEAERQRLAAIEAAKLDPATYEVVSDRDFALLMKNPDAAKGRKLVLYGVVSQFDSATGTTSFRANTAAGPQDASYDYDQNTVVTGASNVVANVVEDDFVTLYVEVVGSYSYSTTMGGSTTVPKVQANIIEVTG